MDSTSTAVLGWAANSYPLELHYSRAGAVIVEWPDRRAPPTLEQQPSQSKHPAGDGGTVKTISRHRIA